MNENQKTKEILSNLMSDLEKWRVSLINSISPSSQIISYHLICVTEEKFRMARIRNIYPDDQYAHTAMRNDLFALEWALRSIKKIPDNKNTSENSIRGKWDDRFVSICMKLLAELTDYCHIRDIVISTNRGGYTLSCPNSKELIFKDVPNWLGYDDQKSRDLSHYIQEERFKSGFKNIGVDLKNFSINGTFGHEDFPFGLDTSEFSSHDFWKIWNCLLNICVRFLSIHSKPQVLGGSARTTHAKDIAILRTKVGLINQIANITKINKKVVSKAIRWLTFNETTPNKFTLLHCPIVEINNINFAISPHSVLLAYPPTVYSRLFAYYDKDAYDSFSIQIEKNKLKQIQDNISSDQNNVKTRVKLSSTNYQSEVDLVEFDNKNNTICIVQAKFFIAPDAVAEVDNSNKQIKKAINQLEISKKIIDSGECNEFLKELFKLRSLNGVNFSYFLLSSDFSGSDFLEIPPWINSMHSEFCVISKYKGKTLSEIWNEYKALWDSLEEPAKEARVENIEINLAGYKVITPGFIQ